MSWGLKAIKAGQIFLRESFRQSWVRPWHTMILEKCAFKIWQRCMCIHVCMYSVYMYMYVYTHIFIYICLLLSVVLNFPFTWLRVITGANDDCLISYICMYSTTQVWTLATGNLYGLSYSLNTLCNNQSLKLCLYSVGVRISTADRKAAWSGLATQSDHTGETFLGHYTVLAP